MKWVHYYIPTVETQDSEQSCHPSIQSHQLSRTVRHENANDRGQAAHPPKQNASDNSISTVHQIALYYHASISHLENHPIIWTTIDQLAVQMQRTEILWMSAMHTQKNTHHADTYISCRKEQMKVIICLALTYRVGQWIHTGVTTSNEQHNETLRRKKRKPGCKPKHKQLTTFTNNVEMTIERPIRQ